MTDENKNICGEITADGEICTLPAGWGKGGDTNDGPCKHHGDKTALPRMWTDDRVETIYEALEDVPSLKHAAKEAGVGYRTTKRWKRRGKELEEELTEEELEHDDGARRLVAFRHEVNARTGGGIRSLFSDAIEFARKREDPAALLRIAQQLEGGASDDSGDTEDEDTGWFDDLESAEERVLERHGETEAQ